VFCGTKVLLMFSARRTEADYQAWREAGLDGREASPL